MRRRPPTTAGRPGFTLVELVTVLATITLVAAVTVPRYGSAVARYRVDAAAKRLAADLKFAHARARAGSKAQTVTFSTATAKYQAAGLTGPDNRAGGYTVDLSANPYRAVIVSANFGGQAQVTFDPYGAVDSQGLFTTGSVVVAVGAWRRTVSVDAGTGRVAVN